MTDSATIRYACTHVPGDPVRDATVARQLELIPDLIIVEDSALSGVWPTTEVAYLKCLADLKGATHILILQDDMYPCDTFIENARLAATAVPNKPVQLFSMRKGIQEAAARGDRWVRSPCGVWGGSTILPVEWIQPFLKWIRKCVRPDAPGTDDGRLGLYLHANNLGDTWHTCPPLLQHVCAPASLIAHNNATRISSAYRRDQPVYDWTVVGDPPTQGSTGIFTALNGLTSYGTAWIAAHK